MPNRIIKESINESRGLSQVSSFAQDLYKRLITYADDYGRFNSDVEIVRARLYPREMDAISLEMLVDGLVELVGIEKIVFYQGDKRVRGIFGYFPNWTEHQRVRNSRQKCPEPVDTSVNDWYLRRFVPMGLKVEIFERDDFTCQLCRRSFKMPNIPTRQAIRLLDGAMHVDHIVPVDMGGRATAENLRILCASCNLTRPRKLTAEDFAEPCRNLPLFAASDDGRRPESESESESESEAAARAPIAPPASAVAAPQPPAAAAPRRPPNRTFAIAEVLARLCGMDLATNKGRLLREAKTLQAATSPPFDEVILQAQYGPEGWWWYEDWRGKRGELPRPEAIRETWGKWLKEKGTGKNGTTATGRSFGLTALKSARDNAYDANNTPDRVAAAQAEWDAWKRAQAG